MGCCQFNSNSQSGIEREPFFILQFWILHNPGAWEEFLQLSIDSCNSMHYSWTTPYTTHITSLSSHSKVWSDGRGHSSLHSDSFWPKNIFSCWERHRIDSPEQHANSLNPFISITLTAGTHAGSSFHRREYAARQHLKVICLHLLMPPCTDVLSLNLRKTVTAPFYSTTSHRGSLSSEQRTVVQNESGLL